MLETQYWRARSPQHQKNALLSTDCLSCPSERTLITWYWNSSICKLTHARSFLRHSLPPASTLSSEKSTMHNTGTSSVWRGKELKHYFVRIFWQAHSWRSHGPAWGLFNGVNINGQHWFSCKLQASRILLRWLSQQLTLTQWEVFGTLFSCVC